VRIWFYERETRELVRINQCELIESFLEAQRDYAKALAFALISETTEAVLGEREPAEANFRLVLAVARAIRSGVSSVVALAYFAFWSVRLGGWLPRLDRCSQCGAEFSGSAHWAQGRGLVCGNCRLPGHKAISQAALGLMRRMSTEKLEPLTAISGVGRAAFEVLDFMLGIIEHHIEKHLQSYRLLEQSLEFGA